MEVMNNCRLFSFALLTVLTYAAVVVRGQVCQQSLPSQYVPEDDTQSIQPSSVGTLYVYPNAFNSTECLGRVTGLHYSFCYLINRSMSGGGRPNVFTVLLLGNAVNSYTVLNSYTEQEARGTVCSTGTTCCQTVDVPLPAEPLSIQSDLALGIVIPSNTGSNFLYEALNETSMGFTVATANLPSNIIDVDSTISKSSLGQSTTLINNRRFSLTFETQAPTTTMGPDMMATTNQTTGTSSGGAVAAAVIVILLVIGGATAAVIVVVVILRRRRLPKSGNIQGTSPYNIGAFENQIYEQDTGTINGRLVSSENEEIHDYSLPSNEVYEDMDQQREQPYETPITDSMHTGTQRSRGATHPLPPVPGIDPYGNHFGSFSTASSLGRYTLSPMTLVSKGKSGNFQEEESIYQDPAESEAELYEQYKYLNVTYIQRTQISTTDILGEGQFGVVYLGEWTKPGEEKGVPVAVKTLKEGAKEEDKVKFLQEAAIIGQFSHPNVVKLYGIVTEEEKMIVLELLQGGDLHHALLALNQGSEGDVKLDAGLPHTLLSYCRQVASGMAYLSQKDFVHRDLAARNILLSEDCECKITDFGMSRDLAHTDYYVSHGGKVPVRWTAPEAINYKKYSTASDVWSFGCVMYEIWSLGKKPFGTYSNSECIQLTGEGIRLPPPPGCPRTIYALMMDCWHPSASSRPDFVSVVQQLSLPDTKLLKWSEEDKAIDPEAATLGAGLDHSVDLYKDMQERYIDTQDQ